MLKKLLITTALLLSLSAVAETVILKADNTVSLNTDVSDNSITALMLDVQRLNKLETDEPIYLVLNTPGGSVFAGIDFIRFARTSRRPIHTVTIFAASMGFQIVQGIQGKRLMAYSGVLMSHRAAVSGIGGQYPGELNVRVDFLQDISTQLDYDVAKRAGMSLKDYQSLIHDEYYASTDKAIKDGFADESTDVSCDVSLEGSYTKDFETLFGPIEVEFSSCPLITGFISAKFKQSTEENKTKNPVQYITVGRKVGKSL
jgi:ATP-dependent Clp protease, protease subunit